MSFLAKTCFLVLLFLNVAVFPATAHRPGDPEDVLEMGVFPFLSATRMEALFSPFALKLTEQLPYEVRYRSTVDYKTYMNRLDQQWYDIAYVQPFDYVRIAEQAGYLPLVAPNIQLRTLFVVKAESPLKNLGELRGKSLALPPEVAAVNILAQAKLAEAGINPNTDLALKHTKSHDACLQQLLIDKVDACALAPNPLKLFQSRSQQKLRIIAESQVIPAPLFVVHSRISKTDRDLLRKKLLALQLPKPAQKLWGKEVNWAHPVKSADYNQVRDIQRLVTNQKPTLSFGAFPFVPPRQLEQNCGYLVKTLGDELGMSLRLRTSRNYASYSDKLKNQVFDLALIQPFDYPQAAHAAGYRPLMRNSLPLKAIFAVQDDSSYQTLSDLQEQTLALPPESAAVSRLALEVLEEEGLVPDQNIQLDHLPEHFSCLKKVLRGDAAACVTAERALQVFSRANDARFRIIATSREIPHVLFVAHQRLPAGTLQKLNDALEKTSSTESGLRTLKNCGLPALIKATTDEYLALEKKD